MGDEDPKTTIEVGPVGLFIIGLLMIGFSGWGAKIAIEDECKTNCQYWWFFFFIIVATTIFLIELSISRQIAAGTWGVHKPRKSTSDSTYKVLGSRWLFGSLRLGLTSILLSLPFFFKLTLGLFMCGIFLGLGLEGLFRVITNRLPPNRKDEGWVECRHCEMLIESDALVCQHCKIRTSVRKVGYKPSSEAEDSRSWDSDAFDCPECGKLIKAHQTRCAHCKWSWVG